MARRLRSPARPETLPLVSRSEELVPCIGTLVPPPLEWPRGRSLHRATRGRPADLLRRRHGIPDHERRPAAALPRGGEHPRAGERPLPAPRLHPRGRRADRDQHVRRQPAQAARRASSRTRSSASTPRASRSPARPGRCRAARCSSPARSGRSATSATPRTTGGRCSPSRRELLEARGVDLFFVETFYDLDELETAIAAVRGVSSLPVVALLTFDEDGETLAGVSAREAALRLRELGVDAVGANHGAGPQACLDGARADGLGRAAARRPSRTWAWPASPADGSSSRTRRRSTSRSSLRRRSSSARSSSAAAAGRRRPRSRPSARRSTRAAGRGRRSTPPSANSRSRPPRSRRETRLARDLREGRWVVSIQLDPPLGGSHAGHARGRSGDQASGLAGFVDINDNATARAAMSGLMMAAAIERAAGIETIPHLTPRDSTIMGLESLLLGAHAEGVRNVLAVTGDPPEVGDYPGSRGRLRARLDRPDALDLAPERGRGLQRQGDRRADVVLPRRRGQPDRRRPRARGGRASARKVDAGARFAMTQILFDLAHLDRFLDELGGSSPIPLLVGLFPVWSYRLAQRLHNEVPGIVVPEQLQAGAPRRGRRRGRGRARAHPPPVRGVAGEGGRRLRRRAVQEAARCARRAPLDCFRSGA